MRIVLVTDAWEPQVNGVVRTLTRPWPNAAPWATRSRSIDPDQFKTFPLPTYPEIKAGDRRLRADAGALQGLRARGHPHRHRGADRAWPRGASAWSGSCRSRPATTPGSRNTSRPACPCRWPAGYAYMKWFHKPSGRLMVATPTMRDELVAATASATSRRGRAASTPRLFRPDLEPIYEDDVRRRPGPRPIFLNVGRVAVEKNIEAFLDLDLPGTKVVVGDGPQPRRAEGEIPGGEVPRRPASARSWRAASPAPTSSSSPR